MVSSAMLFSIHAGGLKRFVTSTTDFYPMTVFRLNMIARNNMAIGAVTAQGRPSRRIT